MQEMRIDSTGIFMKSTDAQISVTKAQIFAFVQANGKAAALTVVRNQLQAKFPSFALSAFSFDADVDGTPLTLALG